MDNINDFLSLIIRFFDLPVFKKIGYFYKNHKAAVLTVICLLVIVLLVRGIYRTVRQEKAKIESYQVPDVIYYPKSEIEQLQRFKSIQSKIDSLEHEKDIVLQQFKDKDQKDIQEQLNKFFNIQN